MDSEKKIETALQLTKEMIEIAEKCDKEHKASAIARGKAEEAVGESWELFYLKSLRDLLED